MIDRSRISNHLRVTAAQCPRDPAIISTLILSRENGHKSSSVRPRQGHYRLPRLDVVGSNPIARFFLSRFGTQTSKSHYESFSLQQA